MIDFNIRKSLNIRFSGRSSDFISPSFGYGCLFKCSYCYMRRNKPKGLNVATNIGDILNVIDEHANRVKIVKPNQTDYQFITYDISCNEDFILHSKFYDVDKVFDFFNNHKIAKATMATKTAGSTFLPVKGTNKIRIRFSLMPQAYSNILEPNTARIIDRIHAVNKYIEKGYEVHLNFSPVIMTATFLNDYGHLFKLVNDIVKDEYKQFIQAEVIFLTHSQNMHEYNLIESPESEKLLWHPNLQETKQTLLTGKEAIRYQRDLKKRFIGYFKDLHKSIIPWNNIRYIF